MYNMGKIEILKLLLLRFMQIKLDSSDVDRFNEKAQTWEFQVQSHRDCR